MFYNTQENAIEFFNDFTRIKSEAKYRTKQGARVKILTPEQIHQRLPFSLTQILTKWNHINHWFIVSVEEIIK